MFRTDKRHADGVFNALWNDPDHPPWDVKNTPIEYAKVRILEPYLAPVRSVIDVACGGGDFLDLVAAKASFEHVVGVDIAEKALMRARRTGRYHELVRAPIDRSHEHTARTFDLVLLAECLQYVDDWPFALAKVADTLVAPRGLLFIAVAVGRRYMRERDVETMKTLLLRKRFDCVEDRRLDYAWLGLVPRRLLPFAPLYFQTHKAVLLYRRS